MANEFDERAIKAKCDALKAKLDAEEQITADDIRGWKQVIENAVTLEAENEPLVAGAKLIGPDPVNEKDVEFWNDIQHIANESFQGRGEGLGQEFDHSLKVHHALMQEGRDLLRKVGSLHELILQTDADNIDQALEWFIPAFTDMVAPGGEAVLDIAGHDPQFYDENNN